MDTEIDGKWFNLPGYMSLFYIQTKDSEYLVHNNIT